MLNFKDVREKKLSFDELIIGLKKDDLVLLTNEMIDTIINLIHHCVDSDISRSYSQGADESSKMH